MSPSTFNAATPVGATIDITFLSSSFSFIILNRVDLPYATFALANSDLTNSYASNGLVYIKRGLYTESCVLSDNTDY